MFLIRSCFLFFVFLFSFSSFAQKNVSTKNQVDSWGGHIFRATYGNSFDFELPLNKGSGYPTEAMFRYGYEYGHQFDSGLYLSAELDWIISYPRSFEFRGKKPDFFTPPLSLWWVPLTNFQVGYAFSDKWLATVGLVYYWGISTSVRYKFTKNLFTEMSSVIWMDRVFNTGGFYGGGYDNLHLSLGFGYEL